MTASMRSAGRRVSRKCSMRMSWPGYSTRAIRPERRSSSTPMKRMPAGAWARKFPMPQPGSSTVASAGTPRRARAVVHRLHDHGRGVEGGKGRPPGAGVVLRCQEGLELVPQLLPAGVFVVAGDRVREDAQGHRAEAGEAGEHGALLGSRGPLGLLDGLERADRRQDGAGFGFLAAGGAGRVGALRRHVAVVGGSLVEVHVVDKGRVWYGREGHGASPCRCTLIKSQWVLANTCWLALCVVAMREDEGLAVNRTARAAPGA